MMSRIIQAALLLFHSTAFLRDQLLFTAFGVMPQCKHSPTCSVYTRQMINQHGVISGTIRGLRRLATCR